MDWMEKETFVNLPVKEVGDIVRASQTSVCVFPFNGTRRWFLLEHSEKAKENFVKAYIEETARGYIRLYQLLFEHGIETVIAPVFGSEILSRGAEYMEQIGASMGLLAEHPLFLSFYKEWDVRVHFYGDYESELKQTKYAYISDLFKKATLETGNHKKHRLFYGVFGSDATQRIAEISIEQYKATGRVPTRPELIEAYYGEYIEKANLFIGFEKFSAFDYPMLNWGEESLYFTVAPSLYMTDAQFREILYDHIYLRPLKEPDYLAMPKEDIEAMQKFYAEHRTTTLGVGEVQHGIWRSKK